MNRRWRFCIWLSVWLMAGLGILIAAWKADRAFQAYMAAGQANFQSAIEWIPSHVSCLAADTRFREHWNDFRASGAARALRGVSPIRNFFDSWRAGEEGESRFEKWVSQFWGPELILAYAPKAEVLYLISPVGNREACADWLRRMALSPSGGCVDWKPKPLLNHVCLEAEASRFLSAHCRIQFSLLHGVAVMAIGRKSDPLQEIIRLADHPEDRLVNAARFREFFERGSQSPGWPFGFLRLEGDGRPADTCAEWTLAIEPGKPLNLDIHLPVRTITTSSKGAARSDVLSRLRQTSDLISAVFSWDDAGVLWSECVQHLPPSWTDPIRQIPSWDSMGGAYRSIWDPIFGKLGREMFLGLGESQALSERYRIPFPRAVLAFPFTDAPSFLNALEATVLKANQELEANLLIRKTVRPFGEYYEVQMGSSLWKNRHGLKQLPVFAFSNGLLILASTDEGMEKTLQNFMESSTLPKEGGKIDARVQAKQAPSTIRVLLATLGIFNPQGENIFLSPSVSHSLSEIFSVMEQFEDFHFDITHQPGQIRVQVELDPH